MLPTVSIIIPTLNSAKTLTDCLRSIWEQDYPQEKLEVVFADGGSSDSTGMIIESFALKGAISVKIKQNILKTGEAGKAAGLKEASGGIIAFIDSDNVLPEKDWLKKMVEPFSDPGILASEPIEYTLRASDGYITRYCAYIGMNDPLCLFLGNYDRYCTLTERWTEMPHTEVDRGGYLEIGLFKKSLPTIGANGFLIRRSAWDGYEIGDYLFDIDLIYKLLDSGIGSFKLAKVKTGIVHIFSGNVSTFARKQRRRVRDYLYYERLGVRKYPWKSMRKLGLLKFILYCVTVFPLLAQSLKGYMRRPNRAWFFHPVACWLTLWEYGLGKIGGVFGFGEFKREGWSQ